MIENTWPDPARPGVPLNPEEDGPHWLEAIDDDGQPLNHKEVMFWFAGEGFYAISHVPISRTRIEKNWRYIAPVLTPNAAASLQARVAELEAALKPFADLGGFIAEHHPDPETDENHETATLVRHFRNAYITLTGGKDE